MASVMNTAFRLSADKSGSSFADVRRRPLNISSFRNPSWRWGEGLDNSFGASTNPGQRGLLISGT